MSFEQIKREVALLDEQQQAELISFTLNLRDADHVGSSSAIRQAMRSVPHLAAADMTVLETAIEHGKK